MFGTLQCKIFSLNSANSAAVFSYLFVFLARRSPHEPRIHDQDAKTNKGRTIIKVMGEGGKPKKTSCKGKCQQKNSCKEEGKEKKIMQKEGPIVTFSESLSFRNQQYYQAQYE